MWEHSVQQELSRSLSWPQFAEPHHKESEKQCQSEATPTSPALRPKVRRALLIAFYLQRLPAMRSRSLAQNARRSREPFRQYRTGAGGLNVSARERVDG